MYVTLEFSTRITEDIIDLTDYGHEEDTKWSDLTEEEQNEVKESEAGGVMVEVVATEVED